MKAIFAGGSHHNTVKEITNANPTLQMTANSESFEKEQYSLISVKNHEGILYAIYKQMNCLQTELNEIFAKFN